MSSSADKKEDDMLSARRLELSLSPEDGSLLTAPLSTALLSTTNSLYSDLYDMVHGELEVPQPVAAEEEEEMLHPALKKERMSNLSFAQRRHELAWRLAQHGKALSHVSALTAAAAASNFAQATRVSTKALQHARSAWVQNDEAQDALYFFHAQLFPARRAPHDVYGALDVLQRGSWFDLPTELKLVVDPYETSREGQWGANEVSELWKMAATDKLLRGEMGWMQSQQNVKVPWKISLKGGIVRLTYGSPKIVGSFQTEQYPLEAHLTVMSLAVPAEWTLLSVEVRAQAKTGESDHQMDSSNRQRYDLHRLCALAMSREEQRVRDSNNADDIPRPLDCLVRVARSFSLSWQLEILTAQAQALKRGIWSAGDAGPPTLVVNPVQFDPNGDQIGVLSVSFWNVDDRYGPPRVDDISLVSGTKDDVSLEVDCLVASKLSLSIRADLDRGMTVALSGGKAVSDSSATLLHIRKTVGQLLDAASSPFALSFSDALLAATTLCGELKSHAVVEALQTQSGVLDLPDWISLSTERGSVDISVRVSYDEANVSNRFVRLFRLGVDSRTGSFVCLFSRSTELLRRLACNDAAVSKTVALQMAKLTQNGRKHASVGSTGRFLRDAFESLVRSFNLLGQRVGVGGFWANRDSESASLRHRAIQDACGDARQSLMMCSGIASVYGLSALALGVASGIAAVPDMAGDPVEPIDGTIYLQTPPLGVPMIHQVVQEVYVSDDGEKRKRSVMQTQLLAISCSVSVESLMIQAFDITTVQDSPVSVPIRTSCTPVKIPSLPGPEMDPRLTAQNQSGERPVKRARTVYTGGNTDGHSFFEEIGVFAEIITSAIDSL